ncbi:MAG: 3-oxoacyl-ACP reductase FabG [Oscillospiraceae bacterium]|nr:3-oxoacyl-ACP reductase FabG [Oscillospiraceae bacterium]
MSKVLITGGSRGIGGAAALLFAQRGWDVAIGYHTNETAAHTMVEQMRVLGVNACAIQADVSCPEQAAALVKQAVEALGGLDALVCSAGIALPQQLMTDTTDEQWRQIFAVNVDGVFYTLRAATPHFVRQKSGSIVTLSSMWGVTGGSCEVAYSAAKGAVIAMTKALAKELGPSGIRVNCVAPGFIATDMNAHLDRESLEQLREETPLQMLGSAEDAARSILFLAGEDAAFVTGQVLQPNGGLVI